ncbi:RNA-binding protein 48 [Wyeomyia smithii]|uniref:RNA-binding protein 48 n=1 Tax=Wyeomyia smithii TaxID=174621 RepID=UPI002467B9E1|nr:RNA-binding protein 48 [Wyeomyia smithii]
MISDLSNNSIELSDHIRHQYCHNRPPYRKSKKPTAVKVYSVANESRHLLVFGVPQINLLRELKTEFRRHGTVQHVLNITDSIRASGNHQVEPFTDVFYVKFDKLEKARLAKKRLDARNFYGGILHITYAPEKESIQELREKLSQRRREVNLRIQKNRLSEHSNLIAKCEQVLQQQDSVHSAESIPKKHRKVSSK